MAKGSFLIFRATIRMIVQAPVRNIMTAAVMIREVPDGVMGAGNPVIRSTGAGDRSVASRGSSSRSSGIILNLRWCRRE
jgi:hypothetical protein